MAWRSSGATNAALVENLAANGMIKSTRVKEAMLSVDRAHFAPAAPYSDSPQPIGHGATISAPHMHAAALESLLPFVTSRPSPRVLDIGSGSGYLTMALAALAAPSATSASSQSGEEQEARPRVVGLEHIPALAELGRLNTGKSASGRALLDSGRVRFVVGDGRKGWTGEGEGEGQGFDAIHVGAAAKTLHPELVEQLRRPGRLFIPVEDEGSVGQQSIWVVDKAADGTVTRTRAMGVRYVPLTDAPAGNRRDD